MNDRRWVHIVGDGVIHTGRCLVHSIILDPDAGADLVTIYDGRDATSGRKFAAIASSDVVTRHLSLGQGVPFAVGVFVDGSDSAVETTVVFTPLDE